MVSLHFVLQWAHISFILRYEYEFYFILFFLPRHFSFESDQTNKKNNALSASVDHLFSARFHFLVVWTSKPKQKKNAPTQRLSRKKATTTTTTSNSNIETKKEHQLHTKTMMASSYLFILKNVIHNFDGASAFRYALFVAMFFFRYCKAFRAAPVHLQCAKRERKLFKILPTTM